MTVVVSFNLRSKINKIQMENNTQLSGDNISKPAVKKDRKAIVSLILGIIGMVVWVIPIAGLVTQITGLVFSVKSMCSSRRGMRSRVWYCA